MSLLVFAVAFTLRLFLLERFFNAWTRTAPVFFAFTGVLFFVLGLTRADGDRLGDYRRRLDAIQRLIVCSHQ